MDTKIFNEENEYYDTVREDIEKEIEECHKEIKEIPKRHTNILQGDEFLVESLLNMEYLKLSKLKLARDCPYFGRIDFTPLDSDHKRKIYVGKTNISSGYGNNSVIDWRTPVCSLYYDSEIGPSSYMSPEGKIDVNVDLKRQIVIEKGILKNVYDTSIVLQDEVLRNYLDVNADSKMKTIVASIQKEQNNIIRKPLGDNMIIQGVAGSGKTSVALHRVAYLAYNNVFNNKTNNFMVLGPNEYFLDYISTILPELETDPVDQNTLAKFTQIFCNLKFKYDDEVTLKGLAYSPSYIKCESFKTSILCRDALDLFMKDYINKYAVPYDFKIDDNVIYSRETIFEHLISDGTGRPNYAKVKKTFADKFKSEKQNIYTILNKKYSDIYKSIPIGEPSRDIYVEKSNELKKRICVDGDKLLREYFKKIEKTELEIYGMFIENIDKYVCDLSEEEIAFLKEYMLPNIKVKKVGFSDLAPILYISSYIRQPNRDIANVIIDEAQDYGLLHFYALRRLFPQASFNIYGDIAQSLYSYRSISSWDEVITYIFNGDCNLYELLKSYRTTKEITELSNMILSSIGYNLAEPVYREGTEVNFIDKSINKFTYDDIIKMYSDGNYHSMAIVCKTIDEAKKLSAALEKNSIPNQLIVGNEKTYNSGICVTTPNAAKGLEFDVVVVNDASENCYDSNNRQDMHLLYVACTRALHQLIVIYDKQMNSSLANSNSFVRKR